MRSLKVNKKVRVMIIFITVLISIILGLGQLSLPKLNAYSLSGNNFSVERAMNDLKYISKEKHPVGSNWHVNVEKYITSEISKMNVKYEIQSDKINNEKIDNILVRINGSQSNNTILFMAHYDTANDTYGAGNNGLGTVTLLETLRNIIKQPKPKNDIIFFFTDGEEKGMLGSKLFVSKHHWSKGIDIAFNCEGMEAGPVVLMETNKNSLWILKEVKKATGSVAGYSLITDMFSSPFKQQIRTVRYSSGVKSNRVPTTKTAKLKFGTDLRIFTNNNIEGFTISPVKNYYNYSSELDSYQSVDKRTLYQNCEMVQALINHFGNIKINTKSTQNATFFNVTKSIMVIYSSKLVLPIAIVIALIFISILCVGIRKKIVTIKGVLLGFISVVIMFLVIIFGVSLINSLIRKSILNLNYNKTDTAKIMNEFGRYYFLGVISLVISFGGYTCGKLLKRIRFYDLVSGAAMFLTIVTIATSMLFKNGSYIIAWPSLFGLLGIGYMLWFNKEELKFHEFLPISILSITPGIVLFTPLISLLFDEAVSLGMIHIMMAFMFSVLYLSIAYLYFNFKEKVSDLFIIFGMFSVLMFVTGGMSCLF